MSALVHDDLATFTPEDIDTELAGLWMAGNQLRHSFTNLLSAIERHPTSTQRRGWEELVEDLREKLGRNVAACEPLEREYSRRPWLRYFLVPGGHVHRERNCCTCYPTTEYSWLPSLSGCDEATMVAEWGEVACTVCFPDAPAMKGFGDGTSAVARYTAAEKAARSDEKATKAADKLAKAILPDGSPLRVGTDRIATIIAAERKLSSLVQDFGWYGPTHPHDFRGEALTVAEALLARGIPAERVQGIVDRAAAKVRKEGGTHV